MNGYLRIDASTFCEAGKEHYSRFNSGEPLVIKEAEYDEMLDAVHYEIMKVLNRFKQSYYKDEIQLSSIDFKLSLPCLTKTQKEESAQRRQEEEEKKEKKRQLLNDLKLVADKYTGNGRTLDFSSLEKICK